MAFKLVLKNYLQYRYGKNLIVLNVTLTFVIIITKALQFVPEYYTISFLGMAGLQTKRGAETSQG